MNEPSLSIQALLDRSAANGPPNRPTENGSSPDEEGYAALAGGRIGNRPQWTLVFQQASGAVRGFPYAQFDGLRAEDPERGFIVMFAGVEIEVSGHNLGRVVRAVCEHRAAAIVEATRAQGLLLPESEPVVSAIRIREPQRHTA